MAHDRATIRGKSIPDYRASGAVPPVVPVLLGMVVSLFGDALVAIRIFAVLILSALGASAYFVGATLFRSPRTGLLVTVLALLVVDQFLDLFAFGGLLQATSIVLRGSPWPHSSERRMVRAVNGCGGQPGRYWWASLP